MPKVGEMIKQSQACAAVESVKAASDVYAPFSGKVISVNQELSGHPELLNQSPYEKGYILVMEISNEAEKAKLMDADSYSRYLESLAK